MSGDLLTTRLALPQPAPDLIRRPALLDRLTAAVEHPLTLVAAPAGSGKTSLVSAWAREGLAPGPVAWVSLDGERLGRDAFWRLVLTSVEAAFPGERSLADQGPTDGALVAFGNRMAAQRRPAVLVLDDFHEVDDPAILADLDVLVEHPAGALRLMLLSRRDPALRLVRLRVAGRVAELRARDLAFSPGEADAFLREAVPDLSHDDSASLLRRTEGWAAGLRLAVLSLKGHADPAGFVADFAGTDSAVSDYLLTEVLERLAEDEARFLLRISLVDAICGDLADALDPRGGGGRHLQRMAVENAMLEPVDGRAGWYRFHPLLRDLLRAELRAHHGGELPGLHKAAAVWLSHAGLVRAATRHALAAGDLALATRVVSDGWVELLLDGGLVLLRSLVEMIPPEVIAGRPELALARGALHIEDGELEAADASLAAAAAGAAELPAERALQFRVAYAVVGLRRARLHGDAADGLAAARRLIGDDVPQIAAPGLRQYALANIGACELWAGEYERAEMHLEAALGGAEEHAYVAALALSHLALRDGFEGRFRRAERRAREAVAIIQRHGWIATSGAAAAYCVLGTVAYHRDDLEAAEQALLRASEALGAAPQGPLRALVALTRARVMAARGDAEAALAMLAFERLVIGDLGHPLLDGTLVAQRSLLLDALGEPADARAALRRARPAADIALARARLALRDGDPAAALELLGPVGGFGKASLPSRVQAHGACALAHDALLDHAAAGTALRRALELAEPGGIIRPLIELGPALRPALRREIRAETAHRALVGDLLDALEGHRSAVVMGPRPIEPLSERELTVLRFLPTMMSNQEIASELFVSVNTLKTHLKQIYRKLDVTSRRDAVERAREMALLAPGVRSRA